LGSLDYFFLINEEEHYRKTQRNASSPDLSRLEGGGKKVEFIMKSPVPTINGEFSGQFVGDTYLRVSQ